MDLTRRGALLGATAVGLVACTHDQPRAPVAVDPDLALLADAVARERTLLAAYRAAPRTPVLIGLVADVLAHLTRLAAVPLPQPTASAPLAPAGGARALARATSTAHAAAVPLASRRLAPVLASLAASAATHATLL